MIKDNQQYFNRIHVILDAVITVLAYAAAWAIRFKLEIWDEPELVGVLSPRTYFSALVLIVPMYLILNYINHLYSSKRFSTMRWDVFNVLKVNVIGLVIFLGALYVIDQKHFSRSMIFIFAALHVIGQIVMRAMVRAVLHLARRRGYNMKYVLLVGYSRAAEQYIDRIMQNPQWGMYVRGVLDDRIPRGTMYKGVKVIGSIANLEYILPQNHLDEIAITLALKDYDKLETIVDQCEKSGVHTKFIPDYNSVIPSRPYTEDLNGLPVVNIRRLPLSNTINSMIKRGCDIIGSICALILTSPVLLVCAIVVKVTSPGPVIYKQERIGLNQKSFVMYKFRSMEVQKPSEEKKEWTTRDDPRVTGIGKIMRMTSIDELPQFYNVLKGDMSIIGPRPERPYYVEKFKEEIPRYMVKHQVRPGISGWAQINGYRGDTSIKKRIDYDLYYIENWTLGFDLKIFILSLFKGFINKNAY